MGTELRQERDVTIPLSVLVMLASGAASQDSNGSVHSGGILARAGVEMGTLLSLRLAEGRSHDRDSIPTDRFWMTLSDMMNRRGWGEIEVTRPHPGVAVLVLRTQATARSASSDPIRIEFTAGILKGALESVAGSTVAVLPLEAEGSEAQSYAIGSPETIQALSGALDEAEGSLAKGLLAL